MEQQQEQHELEDDERSHEEDVHPAVERSISEGTRRRYSRNSFCLAGISRLESQDVSAIVNFLAVDALAVNRLVFVQTQFSMQSIYLFANFLARQTSTTSRIKKLIFSSVVMNDDQVSLLFAAIARNRSIGELVFHDCCFDIDESLGCAMSLSLPRNPGVKTLNLTCNGSTGPGLFHLTSALKNVTELSLSDCELDCSKTMVLFDGLLGNRTLRSLDLSKNNILAPSLQVIAKFLRQPIESCLQTLSLAENRRLFDEGNEETKALAMSLCVNRTLKELELERCGLNEKTAALLFRALETNHTLEDLNVKINSGIGATGHEIMVKSIPYFRGLRSLEFDALYPQHDQSLLAALQRNGSLTKMWAHYGLDQCVQEQVNAVLRRNQLYRTVQMIMFSASSTDRIQRGLAAVCVSRLSRLVRDPLTPQAVGSTAVFSVLRSLQLWPQLSQRVDKSNVIIKS